MEILLAPKQTADQKKANEYTSYQFVRAMMSMDERMVFPLLKKDARFMGNMTNWQFVNWLAKQFGPLKSTYFGAQFKEEISLDTYPGCEMFEFSFSRFHPDSSDEDFFSGNGINSNNTSNNEKVTIRLVLLFENGQITDIRIPKKGICLEKINKYQIEN